MENSISGVTIIFQLIGFQYFSIDSKLFREKFHDKKEISKKHKFLLAFSLFLVSVQSVGVYQIISMEIRIEQNENVNTGLRVQFTAFMAMIVVILATLIYFIANTENLKQIFCNFDKISSIFANDLNVKVDYESFTAKFKHTMIGVNLSFSIAATLAFCLLTHVNSPRMFLWAILSLYPYYFMLHTFCYLMFFALLVRENLISMKRVLEKLHAMRFQAINFQTISDKKNDELLKSVHKLKRIHVTLCDTTAMINHVCGFPIMIQLLIVVIGCIASSYKLYLTLMGDMFLGRAPGE